LGVSENYFSTLPGNACVTADLRERARTWADLDVPIAGGF
jgi:hypothetical protein